jgi:GNAT superfamily N-acetyltransferase
VQTPRDLAAFAKISAANWSPPDPDVRPFYELAETALLAPDTPQWLYLGVLDTIPVATAELTVGGGLVGVYNVSTVPAFRGRGIGTAMTHTPLAAAKDAGHRTAILQAAPDGVRVYQRLGFASFGTITEFKPGP